MGTKLPRKLEDKMKVVGGRTKARKTKGAGIPAPTYMNIVMKAGTNSVLPSFRKSFVYNK